MSEINATPATEVVTSETQDFLSSVGESEKRVRVSGKAVSDEVALSTKDVNVYYGDHHALHNTSLDFHKGEITALIGPSGCGKSTFLRSLNLMNREIRGCRVEGEINYRGRNVNTRTENTYELRRSIGMVFQQPNPFRKSIRDNITFAPKRTASPTVTSSIAWSRRAYAARRCGTSSRTSSTRAPTRFRAVSSNVCALRARWRSTPT